MRNMHFPVLVAVAVAAILLTPAVHHGQPPGDKGKKGDKPKPPPDEFKSIVKELEEAYKAPLEVDKDILDELRKQYKEPKADREAKILREARRLYKTTPEQEDSIIQELRVAYEKRTPEQEQVVFQAIRRNGQLAPGTVPPQVQASRAEKLFREFDRDRDGGLSREEAPESLQGMWRQFDRNRDGTIEFAEYCEYYQAHLRVVSEKVASGEIEIKLPRGAKLPGQAQAPLPNGTTPAKPIEQLAPVRFGKLPEGLPDWFTKFDTDKDAQISLYEWRQENRTVEEFDTMDRDGDFLLTAHEVLQFLATQAKDQPAPTTKTKGKK